MVMSNNSCFYLFDRPTDMTLVDYILNLDQPLGVHTIKRITFELLQTVQMLHAKGVVHLDLNPENILVVDADGLTNNKKVSDHPVKDKAKPILLSGGAPILENLD